MIKYQTLHAHTTTSDGKFSYKKILDLCRSNNIGVVAFTDHDSLPTKKSMSLLKKYKGHETKWIIGIEISSGWPLDLGGGATSGLHLIGLFVNPNDANLIKHCKRAKDARITRMEKIVRNLNSLGFALTKNDCLMASGGESVGRPHIVEAINYHPENRDVYEKMIKQLKNDSKSNLELSQKYKYLQERGEDQYPYILFLSEDSYIPGVYVDYQYYSDFDKSVNLIRNAGGVAILAHWMSCKNKLDKKFMERAFNEKRLDGAEVVYGLSDYNTSHWKEREKEMNFLKSLVRKTGQLESGGCDAHTLEDLREFNKQSWYAKRTFGMAEKIIKSSKVDRKFSSF